MYIYGQAFAWNDFDSWVLRLQEGPSPFENVDPRNAPHAAHGIGQGELGFSADKALGTKHLGSCIALIAKNLATGKVACAHIDEFSSPQSIAAIFDDRQARFDVMLLGGRLRIPRSWINLEKIFNVLKDKNIHIIAARILNMQSEKIYVDPKTFQAFPDMLEARNPHEHLNCLKAVMTGGEDAIDLDVVFDFTKSSNWRPILIREQEAVAFNNHIQGKTDEDITTWLLSRNFTNDAAALAKFVRMINDWNVIYQKTLEQVARTVGVEVEKMRHAPLYLGVESLAANIALYGSDPKQKGPRGALENKNL